MFKDDNNNILNIEFRCFLRVLFVSRNNIVDKF